MLRIASCAGSETMGKFVETFKELGRAGELLKTQANLIMVERLQTNWTKVSSRPYTLCFRPQTLNPEYLEYYPSDHRRHLK